VLYVDSSVLIKRYVKELGTDATNKRFEIEVSGPGNPFTSALTYAEIHATLARKTREKLLSTREFKTLQDKFDSDWVFGISPIELAVGVLGSIKEVVVKFSLRGADAVQLASALWLRDAGRLGAMGRIVGAVTFATSDKQLLKAALAMKLEVFNPEDIP
jgi:hypothetical protein